MIETVLSNRKCGPQIAIDIYSIFKGISDICAHMYHWHSIQPQIRPIPSQSSNNSPDQKIEI